MLGPRQCLIFYVILLWLKRITMIPILNLQKLKWLSEKKTRYLSIYNNWHIIGLINFSHIFHCRTIWTLCTRPCFKTSKNSRLRLMITMLQNLWLRFYSLYLLDSNFLNYMINYMKSEHWTVWLILESYLKLLKIFRMILSIFHLLIKY